MSKPDIPYFLRRGRRSEVLRVAAISDRAIGTVILEHEPVCSIRRGRTGGFVLETDNGHVRCRTLVVAAGGWANAILQHLGLWLPLVPLVATRLTTEPLRVPRSLAAIQFCDGHRIYLREDLGSLTWGCQLRRDPRYAFLARELPDRLEGLSVGCVAKMQQARQEVASAVPASRAQGLPEPNTAGLPTRAGPAVARFRSRRRDVPPCPDR
jgi:glycine/D-amino acid oxidase-like deaminating enzyme